jgi:hypothetical protein
LPPTASLTGTLVFQLAWAVRSRDRVPTLVFCLVLPACGEGPAQPQADTESEGDSGSAGDGDGDPSTGDGDGAPGDGDGEPSAAATYWKDTKEILDARCVSCHVEGGIAPFALETWPQVQQWAPILAPSIGDLSMPPWPPNPTCNTYADDRSLTLAERELLLEWIDAGYSEGDPADAPADPDPLPFNSDFTVTLAEPYTPSKTPDDYRCFVIPWPAELTEPAYVIDQLALPDQVQQVHHVITFVAGPSEAAFYIGLDEADPAPGYECFGGPGKLDWTARWLGAWVPGMSHLESPEGTGVQVDPGSSLIVQIHYNAVAGEAVADQTSLAFKVTDTVERPGTFIPIVNYGWVAGFTNMTIPAGEADVHHGVELERTHDIFAYLLGSQGFGPTEEVDVWRSALHMHLLGTRAELRIEQEDATEDCLLQIDDWDFNWQGDYRLEQPVAFGVGDTIKLDCWYDNSEANQPLVDGQPKQPETVGWGEGTYDEMCLGVIYVAHK